MVGVQGLGVDEWGIAGSGCGLTCNPLLIDAWGAECTTAPDSGAGIRGKG